MPKKPNRHLAVVVAQLVRDGHLGRADGCTVRRTYAGRHQRSEGAWSFWIEQDGVTTDIGSAYPLTECAKAAKRGTLVYYESEIYSGCGVELIAERAES